MHHVIVVCPTCGETRYRSVRPMSPKEAATPDLFVPVGDAPPLEPGPPKPALCHACGTALAFRREPDGRTAAPGAATTPGAGGAVTTLFQANPDESIVSMKEVAPDVFVAVTSRRIVKVDLRAMAPGGDGMSERVVVFSRPLPRSILPDDPEDAWERYVVWSDNPEATRDERFAEMEKTLLSLKHQMVEHVIGGTL